MGFDIVIHNGVVITANSDFDIIENGVVCIIRGRLERIDARAGDKPLPEAEQIIDAKGGIIMPGLVNTHTHLPMTL
ncbi:MAG: amidohydrolase, partial [Desulfobacterales bacterium]